jgi:hypothetical protein
MTQVDAFCKTQVESVIKENLNIFQPKLLKLKTTHKLDGQTDLDRAYIDEKKKFVQKMMEIDEMRRQAQPTEKELYQSGKGINIK